MSVNAFEVLLVDDQLVVRGGVELLLRDAGLRIAGLGSNAAEAAGLLRRRRFDVALVEAMLDGEPTAPLIAELLGERPGLPVCVYAGRDDDGLLQAAEARPPGLVLKASPPARLLDAVHAVAVGRRYVDPDVARRLPERALRRPRRGLELLSPREREVLRLLARGYSGAEIAGELFLSGETVRTHVRNAVRKLGARTRTQAVAQLVDGEGVPRDALSLD